MAEAFRYGDAVAAVGRAAAVREIRSGSWTRSAHGVYLPAGTTPASAPCKAAALGKSVLLAVGAECVSHEWAAVVHGFALLDRPALPTLLRDAALGRTPDATPTARLLCARLDPDEVVVVAGCAVTAPARTVVDCARTMPFRAGVVLADSALRAGVDRDDVVESLGRCPGWPGIRRARAVVAFADPLAETPLESVSRVAWWEEQLPTPRLQVTLGDGTADGRPDFYWDEQRTVGEADGVGKYAGPAVVHAEKDREDRLESLGLVIVRWGWAHVQPATQRYGAQRVLRAFDRARRLGYC